MSKTRRKRYSAVEGGQVLDYNFLHVIRPQHGQTIKN